MIIDEKVAEYNIETQKVLWKKLQQFSIPESSINSSHYNDLLYTSTK